MATLDDGGFIKDNTDSIVNRLTKGKTVGDGIQAAALNFLRAQDSATMLELMMNSLDVSLTADNVSSFTSVTTTGLTNPLLAGTQVGNTVTFTSGANNGLSAVVATNTASVLTFTNALPNDTAEAAYTITGAFVQPEIDALRDGKGSGFSPAGNVYGDRGIVQNALLRIIKQLGGSVAYRTMFSGTTTANSSATSTTSAVKVDFKGTSARIDSLKHLHMVIGGEVRTIVGNSEDTVTVSPGYTSIPGDSAATTIRVPEEDTQLWTVPHPGGHPDNIALADLIVQALDAIGAFVLPS